MRKESWQMLVLLLLLSGCTLLNREEKGPSATQTASIPTPAPTPSPEDTPQATIPAEPSPSPDVINVWLIGETSPSPDAPGGSVLTQQLAEFDANHPDLSLNVEVKAPTGQGGTLSYLRTGRGVAPTILPDLIVLPVDQLKQAASEQLIFPMDTMISQDMEDDLFPVADATAQIEGTFVGYPFALGNIRHLAFSTSVYTDTVPTTWNDFAAFEEASFVFPGAGTPGAELALQLYLASGGVVADEIGRPILEIEPLRDALDRLSSGRASGLILQESSNLTTLEESWEIYVGGIANSVQTDEDHYPISRPTGPESLPAAIPGPDGPLVPLATGLAWAISTPDPARQALAGELFGWMVSSQRLGEWSYSASTLPSRRSAFEQWPSDDDYVDFLMQELQRAEPFPPEASGAVMAALRTAVFDVLSLAKSPQIAAEEAAAAVGP